MRVVSSDRIFGERATTREGQQRARLISARKTGKGEATHYAQGI